LRNSGNPERGINISATVWQEMAAAAFTCVAEDIGAHLDADLPVTVGVEFSEPLGDSQPVVDQESSNHV